MKQLTAELKENITAMAKVITTVKRPVELHEKGAWDVMLEGKKVASVIVKHGTKAIRSLSGDHIRSINKKEEAALHCANYIALFMSVENMMICIKSAEERGRTISRIEIEMRKYSWDISEGGNSNRREANNKLGRIADFAEEIKLAKADYLYDGTELNFKITGKFFEVFAEKKRIGFGFEKEKYGRGIKLFNADGVEFGDGIHSFEGARVMFKTFTFEKLREIEEEAEKFVKECKEL